MNRANQGLIHRDAILDRVLAGHTPGALASQFGVTKWTIRRWLAHAQRRRQLPNWKQMAGAPSGSHRRAMSSMPKFLQAGWTGAAQPASVTHTPMCFFELNL
jgi:transposase